MCLFYLNSKGTLLPVAIQLFAKPGPENPVSTNYYHPRMRVGNVFGHVCVSVCLSVCLSVQAITFKLLHIKTSCLVCWYILTISRPSLSIKVIGSRSRSYEKNDNFTYFNMLITIYGYRSLIRSRSHIKVKVTSRSK